MRGDSKVTRKESDASFGTRFDQSQSIFHAPTHSSHQIPHSKYALLNLEHYLLSLPVFTTSHLIQCWQQRKNGTMPCAVVVSKFIGVQVSRRRCRPGVPAIVCSIGKSVQCWQLCAVLTLSTGFATYCRIETSHKALYSPLLLFRECAICASWSACAVQRHPRVVKHRVPPPVNKYQE